MSRPKLISAIYKSLLRMTHELKDEIAATTSNRDIGLWDWENRAPEADLPETTLIGISGYGFDEKGGLWVIRFGLTLSSFADSHLLNEAEALDIVYARLHEKETVPFRDPETGEVIGEFVVTNFDIAPMGQSELRNYRTISVELKRTSTASV